MSQTLVEATHWLETSHHARNPYLSRSFAPINDESTFTDLQVEGEIPRDLFGAYYRNGPNPKYEPKGRYHWFDGDGMVHGLYFENGTASYRNAWVRTEGLLAEDALQQSRFSGLIEPDFSNPLGYIKDNANTDIIFHNGKLYCLFYRSGKPYALNPRDLETIGPDDFGGLLTHPISAHAKVDERTGEMMIFDYGHKAPYLWYGVVSPEGVLKSWVPVELPGQRFPHDMAITENYSILMDMPVFFDQDSLKLGKHRMAFHPEYPTRFAILPRHGNEHDIRWFEASPCYVYHVINAWEEGDEIVLDLCRVSRPVAERDGSESQLTRMKKVLSDALQTARYHRYRFNLKTGATHEEQRSDLVTEFPMVNLSQMGYQTRYSYHVSLPPTETLLFDGIVKYDSVKQTEQRHAFGKGRFGSEAPFAPRLGGNGEDDGYVVSFVNDENTNRSECMVLDARNINGEPLARVFLPRRVPLGFHATWVPGQQLG